MVKIRSVFKKYVPTLAIIATMVLLPFNSLVTAEGEEVCVTPEQTTSFRHPDGASAHLFVYNCDTGLFESEHYSYNPQTGVRAPLDPRVYTCDPETRTYNVTIWVYNAPSGKYRADAQNVSQPPAGAEVVECPPLPAPEVPEESELDALSTSDDSTEVQAAQNIGSGSTAATDSTVNNNGVANNTTGVTVNNTLNSNSNTGNLTVLDNTTVGDVDSGNATVVATQMNMLQSTNNFGLGGTPITFMANINGDVNGDLLLDPATLGTIQPAGSTDSLNNSIEFNNEVDASINNELNLNANSGDVTVNDNTRVGNVTTGDASIVANVVNTINSAVNAGQSFVGIININGNLNGDILLPPDFVDQLIAANVPTVTITAPGSLNDTSTTVSNNTEVNNTNTHGINNEVNASAQSGDVNAADNTRTGDISSGNATTSITAFNLTGSTIIGKNAILVFVNVLGEWVGLIVNAPAGSTAAGLGGGVSQITNVTNDAELNNNTNHQINNVINANATSGDINANDNTGVGNLKTGNADIAVNILNVSNSSLSLDGWFGILFINVFGKWNGSFGVDTIAGNQPLTSGTNSPAPAGAAPPTDQNNNASPQMFRFVAAEPTLDTSVDSTTTTEATSPTSTATLASTSTGASAQTVSANTAADSTAPQSKFKTWTLPVAGLFLGALLLGIERVVTLRQRP